MRSTRSVKHECHPELRRSRSEDRTSAGAVDAVEGSLDACSAEGPNNDTFGARFRTVPQRARALLRMTAVK